jgi:hypothetical protein
MKAFIHTAATQSFLGPSCAPRVSAFLHLLLGPHPTLGAQLSHFTLFNLNELSRFTHSCCPWSTFFSLVGQTQLLALHKFLLFQQYWGFTQGLMLASRCSTTWATLPATQNFSWWGTEGLLNRKVIKITFLTRMLQGTNQERLSAPAL